MNLKTADLLSLQTKHMQADDAVRGFSAALTAQMRKLANETENVTIYSRIDELPENVLDVLAWQFSVSWYDIDSSIEIKRETIKEAIEIHKIRGTPAAVQRVVEIYFGDGQIQEWFDYGGEPYHFRVVTNNPAATNEQAALLSKAVNTVKNLRSRLESVVVISTEHMDLYTGFVLHTGDKLTLSQVV